jgi:hypothetical protein
LHTICLSLFILINHKKITVQSVIFMRWEQYLWLFFLFFFS